MKLVNRLFKTLAAALTVSVLFIGSASAIGEGQIEGGDIYRIKNLTKNSAFAKIQTADKCETLQYKVRLHNPGPGVLSQVNVKVSLPGGASTSHSSTATITSQNAQPATTTATATLNLSTSQEISYESGSTQLLDTNSNILRSLPDGITGGGVSVGEVKVSINEIRFVQFKVKVKCPPVKPVESLGSCKLLDLTVTSQKEREVRADLEGETTNATIVSYRISFGDGAVVNQQSATHTYAQSGTYTVRGHVTIELDDGTIEEKTSDSCVKKVTFEKERPPKVVPPPVPPSVPPSIPPTVLPETGVGGIAAIFSAVTSISTAAYYVFARRST